MEKLFTQVEHFPRGLRTITTCRIRLIDWSEITFKPQRLCPAKRSESRANYGRRVTAK